MSAAHIDCPAPGETMDGLARRWRCGSHVLDLCRTRIMGIVNVTPDSFSDGGTHDDTDAAVAWGLRLLDEGADVLDVGGESTRPGFAPVDPEQEAARVVPVIRELSRKGAIVSVDTRHASVAKAALEAGASIVNDVSGFSDPAMVEVVSSTDCGCVCMHTMPGWPGACDDSAGGCDADDLPDLVRSRLLDRVDALERAGVDPSRICLDPGAGFGTNASQDVAVQRELRSLCATGYPVMCAVSRKRFVGAVSGVASAVDRDAASCGVALAAVTRGARLLRVHDVADTFAAVVAAEAVWGKTPHKASLVALGSNVGDRMSTFGSAIDAIGRLPLTRVEVVSRVCETAPAYLDDQPPFANAVALVRTGLHPLAFLSNLLSIEAAHGRVRTIPNGPRTLDLDLLWVEGETHAGSRLTLPHPRMGERAFVTWPLTDCVDDVERFFQGEGIALSPAEQRLGEVVADLGWLPGWDPR